MSRWDFAGGEGLREGEGRLILGHVVGDGGGLGSGLDAAILISAELRVMVVLEESRVRSMVSVPVKVAALRSGVRASL